MNDLPSQLPSSDNSESPPVRKKIFHFWRCFWLIFLVFSLVFAWYSYYVPSNSIAWADNDTSAQQQAVASGKPIILYFTATWCVPCRIMKRQVWADEQVTAWSTPNSSLWQLTWITLTTLQCWLATTSAAHQSRSLPTHKGKHCNGEQGESASLNSSNCLERRIHHRWRLVAAPRGPTVQVQNVGITSSRLGKDRN
jgi:thiol-disulfide isomerase/thioredoxin